MRSELGLVRSGEAVGGGSGRRPHRPPWDEDGQGRCRARGVEHAVRGAVGRSLRLATDDAGFVPSNHRPASGRSPMFTALDRMQHPDVLAVPGRDVCVGASVTGARASEGTRRVARDWAAHWLTPRFGETWPAIQRRRVTSYRDTALARSRWVVGRARGPANPSVTPSRHSSPGGGDALGREGLASLRSRRTLSILVRVRSTGVRRTA